MVSVQTSGLSQKFYLHKSRKVNRFQLSSLQPIEIEHETYITPIRCSFRYLYFRTIDETFKANLECEVMRLQNQMNHMANAEKIELCVRKTEQN